MKTTLRSTDWPVLIISGGLLLFFVVAAMISVEFVSEYVDRTFRLAIDYFGAYWQVLLLLMLGVSFYLAVSKYGSVRLGNTNKIEMSMFRWVSVICISLLGAGGVFWAAAEPMYYFLEVPPVHNGIEDGSREAIIPALAQSYVSWGMAAWASLGTTGAIVMMYAVYHKGMPMKPRSLLYPLFGEKIANHKFGTFIDAFCIISVAAGTIGPIGILGLQVSYGMNSIFGTADIFPVQLGVIGFLLLIVTISALTGIHKGIQWLSKYNIIIVFVLAIILLLFGPGAFIIDSFVSSFGYQLNHYLTLNTYRGDNDWLGAWMLFFFAWFIGFSPMMIMLIARISKGRTIRELIVAVAVISPLVTNFWFTVVGGSGIFYEINNEGVISEPLLEGGLPAAIIAVAGEMPLGVMMPVLFLILATLFVVTTADSMTYSISMSMTGEGNPPKIIRVFWAFTMAAVAAILVFIGEGSIDALQSFIVVTAVPVSLLILPSLWHAPKIARKLARAQGIIRLRED
ncbi:choline-glycine betaine transporter [Geomicrobium halophilum]|uniref:Choline-glycine betaine transporter n=1 Tax=Geomicrobium halophilum TaxID=549000 RepID=A0A841PZC0_9BACL|nr:BCCT family transporter [Geomicrobium halophilum]MBB6450253.1 choline-glycine betaine transporter [Geomicrobium halophilum]